MGNALNNCHCRCMCARGDEGFVSSKSRKSKANLKGEADFQYNLVETSSNGRVEDYYREGRLLGEGITGSVKEVYSLTTNEKYAMKAINLSRFNKAQLKELENEISLVRSLDHPNIIKIFKVFKSRKNIHIIMELLTGGELSKRILRRERDIVRVAKQLLGACKYWHSRNIVHRDLKLENIMFASDEPNAPIKIIDFGLGTWFPTHDEETNAQISAPSPINNAASLRSVSSDNINNIYTNSNSPLRTSLTRLLAPNKKNMEAKNDSVHSGGSAFDSVVEVTDSGRTKDNNIGSSNGSSVENEGHSKSTANSNSVEAKNRVDADGKNGYDANSREGSSKKKVRFSPLGRIRSSSSIKSTGKRKFGGQEQGSASGVNGINGDRNSGSHNRAILNNLALNRNNNTFDRNKRIKRILMSQVGTAYYMAPEIGLEKGYDNACDLWAIGVIIYMLIAHRPPFGGQTEKEIFYNVSVGKPSYDSPNWALISPHAKVLVENLLQVDPEKRWTAEEALNSPWFKVKKLNKTPSLSSPQSNASSPNGGADLGETIEEEIVVDKAIIDSFKNFVKYTKIKKAALMIIAHKANSAKISKLRDVFMDMDIYNTGTITLAELRIALKNHGIVGKDVDDLFASLDQDRSGHIRYMEFLAATIETQNIISNGELADAFDHLDTDKSGYITKKNLKKLLGRQFTNEEIDQMIKESDLTGDNKVSRDEFMQIMTSVKGKEKDELLKDTVEKLDELALKNVPHTDNTNTLAGHSDSKIVNSKQEAS